MSNNETVNDSSSRVNTAPATPEAQENVVEVDGSADSAMPPARSDPGSKVNQEQLAGQDGAVSDGSPSAGEEETKEASGAESDRATDDEEDEEEGGGSSNIWAIIFVVGLIAFNAYLFLGSKEDASRVSSPPAPPAAEPAGVASSGATLPGPGVTPATPAPTNLPEGVDPNLPGPGVTPTPPAPVVGAQQSGGKLPPPGVTPTPPAPGAKLPGPGEPHPPQPGVVTEPNQPGPGVTPAPPAIQGSSDDDAMRSLSGPQILLGVAMMDDDSGVALSSAQRDKVESLLEQLQVPQKILSDVAKESLSYLSADQVAWIIKNRGPANVKDTVVEPGMDPVTSAASKLLRAKAAKAEGKGKPTLTKHDVHELHFNDVLNGILKMEDEAPKLAISEEQAQVLLPLTVKANQGRQAESKVFSQLSSILTDKQRAWLKENPDKIKLDVNSVIIEYVELKLKK